MPTKINSRYCRKTDGLPKKRKKKNINMDDWSMIAHEKYIKCSLCDSDVILTGKSGAGNTYICKCCKAEFLLRNNEIKLMLMRKGA